MMLLGILPVVAWALVLAIPVAVLAAGASTEYQSWEPVWLGGQDPWAVKVYRSAAHRGIRQRWRVEILLHGEFVHEKTWTGTAGKYMNLAGVQAYVNNWIANYQGGG